MSATTNMNTTETPRTEQFCATPRGLGTGYYQALDFARQLERELAAAHAKVDEMRAALEVAQPLLPQAGRACRKVREVLSSTPSQKAPDGLEREVDRLREELEAFRTQRGIMEQRDTALARVTALEGASRNLLAEMYAHVPSDDVENPPVFAAIHQLQQALTGTSEKPVGGETMGYSAVGIITPRAGDWREDFEHENGRYLCECIRCGETFHGHKRRVVCKVCAATPVRAE